MNKNPYLIFILIISTFFLIFFLPYSIPNFLGINLFDHDTLIKLLSNISVILSSIFGIIIAIFLVAFQIFKDRYVSYSLGNFFKDSNFSAFFILYLTTISMSLISIFFIDNSIYQITIITIKNLLYYLLALFIICLTWLYPFLKKILTSEYPNVKVINILKKIDYSDVKLYIEKYSNELISNKDYFDENKNPHLFLEEMFINSVKRRDGIAINKYFRALRNKFFYLLEHSDDIEQRKDIFTFFRDIYISTAQIAIKENEKSILMIVLDSLIPIYLFCFEEDMIDESLNILDKTLQEILLLLVENKHVLPIRLAVYLYAIKDNIVSILEKKTVENITDDCNIKKQVDILFSVIDRSIENHCENYAKEGANRLIDVYYEVIENNKIGQNAKKSIFININAIYEYFVFKMVDRGLYDVNVLIYAFNSDKILDISLNNKKYGNYPLIFSCEVMIELLKKDILDDFSLENLERIARGVIPEKEEKGIENYEEYLLYILNVFDKLRHMIEKSSNKSILHKYKKLYEQVISINNLINEKKNRFKRINKKVDKIIGTFESHKGSYLGYKPQIEWTEL